MMRLDDREWKPVSISNLFTFVRGRENNMATLEDGDTPLISARSGNNGLKGFVNTPKKIIAGNCITLNNDGDGGAGLAYYQPADMALDTHVTALVPKIEMSMYTMLFISECLSKLHGFFGHGLSISNPRAQKICILLPVTDAGEPDYQFMEDYIRELMEEKKKEYRRYIEERLVELGAVPDDLNVDWAALIDSREWKPLYISQIFDEPQRGKRIVNENHIEGDTPLVSSQGTNNGVTNFVGNEDGVRRFKNCLSIANGGSSAGKCYYQPFEFVAADHVTQCFRMNASPAQYLFLSAIVSKALMGKYGFSHEIKDKALARERVLLPVTDTGEPDYDFMEQFGKKMIRYKYRQYLAFWIMSTKRLHQFTRYLDEQKRVAAQQE